MISLKNKRVYFMLFVMINNICKSNVGCLNCVMYDNSAYTSCFLKSRHLIEYTLLLKSNLKKIPIISALAKSCSEDMVCSECELSDENMYCHFGDFCKRITRCFANG